MFRVEEHCGAHGCRGLVAARTIESGDHVIDGEEPVLFATCVASREYASAMKEISEGGGRGELAPEVKAAHLADMSRKFGIEGLQPDRCTVIKSEFIDGCMTCAMVCKVLNGDAISAPWRLERVDHFFSDYARSVERMEQMCAHRMVELSARHVELHQIFQTNAFELNGVLIQLPLYGLALYEQARLIGHCCRPNCSVITDSCRIYVIADRDIEEGEEITISYVGKFYPEVDQIHSVVKEMYNFECKCYICNSIDFGNERETADGVFKGLYGVPGAVEWHSLREYITRVTSELPYQSAKESKYALEGTPKTLNPKDSNDVLMSVSAKLLLLIEKYPRAQSTKGIMYIFLSLVRFFDAFVAVSDILGKDFVHNLLTEVKMLSRPLDEYKWIGVSDKFMELKLDALVAVTSCLYMRQDEDFKDPDSLSCKNMEQYVSTYERKLTEVFGHERAQNHLVFERSLAEFRRYAHSVYNLRLGKS